MTPETRAFIRGHACQLAASIKFFGNYDIDVVTGKSEREIWHDLIKPYSMTEYKAAGVASEMPAVYETIRSALLLL